MEVIQGTERQKGSAFKSQRKTRRSKLFWRAQSESWAGHGELVGGGGLEFGLPVMGHQVFCL